MRGPLILVTTALLGGAAVLGFYRYSGNEVSDASQPEAAAATASAMAAAVDPSLPAVKVYKSPSCGCCTDWIAHLRENGFAVEVVDTNDMATVKAALGVPAEMGSCHTAEIGDYLVEGHVPASDIKSFLAEGPDARGLAVPGMPVGSPGMEVAGQAADPYDVVAFGADGATAVYRSHR
jgi:hypothetical protein